MNSTHARKINDYCYLFGTVFAKNFTFKMYDKETTLSSDKNHNSPLNINMYN